MSGGPELSWLPPMQPDWRERLKALVLAPPDERSWNEAVALANFRLNFQHTNALASIAAQLFRNAPPPFARGRPERLAILSSSTTTHLHSALRVAALRRGLWLEVYENDYGQYRQELVDPPARLRAFAPTAMLFCLDAEHIAGPATACRAQDEATRALDERAQTLEGLWRLAKQTFGANVLQQTIVPRLPSLIGSNEHRHPASAAGFVAAFNARLRSAADAAQVDLVALDDRIARDGLSAWHSRSFWLKAKQEIALPAAPMFGDLVGRVLAARQGLSAKCLVLDLDNTLWGGVVGDDGPDGLAIGPGTALGEAFLDVQRHARELRRRGVVLAVCSKNDDAVARRAFRDNPDMSLKEADFACFKANWDDKASNLRAIARDLNIGLDSLVFVDDNPFERELVRRELPMVSTPEIGAEPEFVPQLLADAGYFEAPALTDEDFARSDYYARPRLGAKDAGEITDLAGYLAGLEMKLLWGRVDRASLARSAQLVNKTNQFNLTTRRYSEQELRALSEDPSCVCLQLRLLDRFGDNGLIAVVIGRVDGDTLELDSWLMSCRVLGRQVEEATLNVVASTARDMGALRLRGVFLPTSKNAMVSDLYERLGFRSVSREPERAESVLELDSFTPRATSIEICEAVA